MTPKITGQQLDNEQIQRILDALDSHVVVMMGKAHKSETSDDKRYALREITEIGRLQGILQAQLDIFGSEAVLALTRFD